LIITTGVVGGSMRQSPISVLTATLTAATLAGAVLVAVGTAGPASADLVRFYTGYGAGTGATSSAAETAAIKDLNAVNFQCSSVVTLIYDTLSGAVWSAEVSARCVYPNDQ
jgi:hypothetical protein